MHASQSQKLQSLLRYLSLRQFTLAWYRHSKVTFTLLFLAVLGFGGYLWYTSLHHYEWSATRKQQYVEETFTETNLKAKEFEKLLEALKKRSVEYTQPLEISRNLFTGEPAINQ